MVYVVACVRIQRLLFLLLGVVGGIVTSILLTIQKSKCKNIKCCGCECDRDPKLNTNPSETTEP